MLAIQVPKKSDGTNKAFSSQRVTLEGVDYYINLSWNMRAGWFIGMADQDGVAIFSPKRLTPDWDLLGHITDDRRPRGELYCLDTTAQRAEPGFDDLGSRHVLLYLTAEEAAEIFE
jgi:hypothetical protein